MSNVRNHPLYNTWKAMRTRCYNPNAVNFRFYGGRGIQVCDRWRNNCRAFFEDMGERPVGMTLDRINSDGNYSPENCRWATLEQQLANRTMYRTNKSGKVGVHFDRTNKYWIFRRKENGKRKTYYFKTKDEALVAGGTV